MIPTRTAVLILGITAAACSSNGSMDGPVTSPTPTPSLVTGTVTYRERIAVPANATVDVWITDIGPGVVTQAILAEATVPAAGRQVPLPFEVRIDPTRVQATRPYGLRPAGRDQGRRADAVRDAAAGPGDHPGRADDPHRDADPGHVVTRPGRLAAAAACAATFGACVSHTPVASPAAFDHTWQIVGHRFPGVSAIGDTDAARWHGRFVHLQAQRAGNGVDTCDAASYVERVHQAGPFLDTEYRILPAALGIAADAAVRVIEVRCGGQPWLALGGRVLSFGEAGEFVVWDGAFFQLRRIHL